MARYIDAEKLYTRVKEKTNPYGKPTLDYESGVKVLDMIKEAPTADVVEVRHGKWEAKEHTSISTNRHYYTFRCSECKRWNGTHRQNYCPNCGAKMDGGKNDL